MRWFLLACVVAAPAWAADPERFYGWSKDGSWLVYEERVDAERTELFFCQTEAEVKPGWPEGLDELEREDSHGMSCVRFLDPNKAPYQWQSQLVLPAPATSHAGVSLQAELVPDGETPGFVLLAGDKKEACYASEMRESSKLEKSWFHPSGRYVAVMIDGNFRHCVSSLKPAPVRAPKKPVKAPATPKKPGRKR